MNAQNRKETVAMPDQKKKKNMMKRESNRI